MKYIYYVSFYFGDVPGGFGYAEVAMTVPITTFDHVISVAEVCAAKAENQVRLS